MPQRTAQRGGGAGAALRAVAFHKLQPGGGIIKQILHGDAGPLRAAGGGHFLNFSGAKPQPCPGALALCAGQERDMGNGGDGGERLAPEAQRCDAAQPVRIVQLAGGVAQEGDARVLRAHAAAVVRDADGFHASGANFHGDIPCVRVDGVFHQLLYRAGGTLHHLASGDQVRHMGGENIDNRNGTHLLSFQRAAARCGAKRLLPDGRPAGCIFMGSRRQRLLLPVHNKGKGCRGGFSVAAAGQASAPAGAKPCPARKSRPLPIL